MKHIAILATRQSNLGSIDNPRRAFLFVNELLKKRGQAPFFTVQVTSVAKKILLKDSYCTLHCDVELSRLKKTDLIIIPAFDGDIQKCLTENGALIPWIVEQYKKGTEVASLCVGAFLLAQTGLLKGKSCSTHWRAAMDFQRLFPQVKLEPEKIITDECGIYTSGGAFSSANLILYLIEKYLDREIAIECAKMFEVEINRNSQSPFMIFNGQKDHQDDQVLQVQGYMERNYEEKITIEKIASDNAISRRSLERRFKKATGNTLTEYLQRVRMEVAKKQLELQQKNVNEVMYEVGYNDTKAFRTVFRKCTGLSPIEYRNKYHKNVLNTGNP